MSRASPSRNFLPAGDEVFPTASKQGYRTSCVLVREEGRYGCSEEGEESSKRSGGGGG